MRARDATFIEYRVYVHASINYRIAELLSLLGTLGLMIDVIARLIKSLQGVPRILSDSFICIDFHSFLLQCPIEKKNNLAHL